MNTPGGSWETRKVELRFVGKVHHCSVWISDVDGVPGAAFVDDMGIDGAEMRCAAAVG
jgi:hypothetical protein